MYLISHKVGIDKALHLCDDGDAWVSTDLKFGIRFLNSYGCASIS
jgi:hypothetical protein